MGPKAKPSQNDVNNTTQDVNAVQNKDTGPFCVVCGPASPCSKDHG